MNVAARATRRAVKGAKRYGRKQGYSLRIGPTHSKCGSGGKRRVACTAYTRACG